MVNGRRSDEDVDSEGCHSMPVAGTGSPVLVGNDHDNERRQEYFEMHIFSYQHT